MLPMSMGSDFLPETTFVHNERSQAEKELATCQGELVSKGIKTSSIIAIGNDVVGNIVLVIEREHIDMVVLSTHGVSGWRPMVFGSVAEKVVKLAQCPLLLLRSAETTGRRAASN
jgi:nucleotide-binding universal stress UspA family protein